MSIDRERMARALWVAGESYQKAITPDTVEVWTRLFHDLPAEAIENAIATHCKTDRFFPTPAAIRSIIEGTGKAGDIALDAAAYAAADTAYRAAEQVGAYRSVNFKDPLIPRIIRALWGSWPAFCQQDGETWRAFDRKKFADAWKATRRSGEEQEPLMLPGIVETTNDGKFPQVEVETAEVECRYLTATSRQVHCGNSPKVIP